jgi:cell division septum initiation protein DivIVA
MMVLRAGSGGKSADRATGPAAVAGVPNLQGDLDELMDHRPVFRVRMQGYDRLEVDNYTAWVEGELVAVRREVDHLLRRFGECSAELEISRRLLAEAPPGREAFPVSQRVRELLRLAEDEAAAITEAGAHEAERVIAEARTEADARLRKAHEIKEMAVGSADELLEQARRDRAIAAASIERARTAAAEILKQAAVEREQLAAQAAAERERAVAAATAELAAVQNAVDELHRRRDDVRQTLRGLTDRLGEALQAVAAMAPEDLPRPNVAATNVAAEGMGGDDRDEPNVVMMMGSPATVPH